MSLVSTTPIKTQKRHFIEQLRSALDMTWRDALKAEGIGKYDIRNNVYSADDEIDNLLHYSKLMAFYRNSEDDARDRERFIIDYVSPIYTKESLDTVIIPRQSFVGRVVRNVAMLYKQPATRQLYSVVETETQENGQTVKRTETVEAEANLVYRDYIDGAKINVRAKEWHRIYTLCDVVAVRPLIRQKRGKAVLDYDIIDPSRFRVAIDSDNQIRKFMYSSYLYDESGGITETIIVVWTDSEHYYRDAKGKQGFFANQPNGLNPYGVIPFVVMARDETQVYTGGMAGLVESNLHMNYLKMLECEDSAFAAINIPFGVNLFGKDDPVSWSPRRPFFVEADVREATEPSLKYVSGEPHSEMLRMLQEKEERSASMRYGVAPFMLSDNPQELSGKAMKVALTELIEMREDDALVFEAYERELYELTKIVVNYEAPRIGGPTIGDAELYISFAEQSFNDDPTAEYELDKMKLVDNLISLVDMYRKYNTDVDDEQEAEIAIAENKRINTKFRVVERASAVEAARRAAAGGTPNQGARNAGTS